MRSTPLTLSIVLLARLGSCLGKLVEVGDVWWYTDEVFDPDAPLVAAAREGLHDEAQRLIDEGVDPDQRADARSATPLLASVSRGDIRMIHLLLGGADIEAMSEKKSAKLKRQSSKRKDGLGDNVDDDDDDNNDDDGTKPLRIGDFITLRNIPTGKATKRGFLGAEGVLDDNCVVAEQPMRFDECVFQICIQNQYSALREYEENIHYLEELHQIEDSEINDGDELSIYGSEDENGEESDAAKLGKLVDSLERSMKNEKALNEQYMKSSVGNTIQYGSVIQLLHVKSQKYLTVEPNQVAEQERENLRVHLSEFGSSLSWFTVMPCYKIDREGDDFNSGSSLLLRVTERTSEQIHCCELPAARRPRTRREVNCSLETTGWKAVIYSESHDEDARLFCGDIIRVVDPEMNAQVRLVSAGAHGTRSDCVLTPLADAVEEEEHIDSGKYLAVRAEDLWQKGARLAAAMSKFGAGQPSSGEGGPDYKYCAISGGLTPLCSLTLQAPNLGYKKSSAGPQTVATVTDGAPVQIQCQGRWMIVGPAATLGSSDVACLGSANRGGAVSLLFERFVQTDAKSDILVGVAAYPRLMAFLACLDDADAPDFAAKLHIAEPAFMDTAPPRTPTSMGSRSTVDQLADFLLQKPLSEDPCYDELVPSELRDLPKNRQTLLCEQGVLDVLIDVLKRIDVLVEQAALKKHGRNVFLSYVPSEPIAIACLVHMLNTNLSLQETKVSEEETGFIVKMVQESRMQSLYLDLLMALCSCAGRGVDCNQCRVAELWLQDATDLHVALQAEGESAYRATWTLESGTGFGMPPPELLASVRGSELLSRPLPALYLTWDTVHDDLRPQAVCGANKIAVGDIFAPGLPDEKKATIASYFMSQLYLAAELCLDRNYLSIGIVKEQLPFPTCIAIVMDPTLPNDLKASMIRVISTVYVDTDPAVKSVCPHLAHTWSTLSDAAGSRPKMPDKQRIAYLLLQDFLDQYLYAGEDNQWDGLRQRTMELLLKLVQFSFYSTASEMSRLVQPLVSDLSRVQNDAESAKKNKAGEDNKALESQITGRIKDAAKKERTAARRGANEGRSPLLQKKASKYKLGQVAPDGEEEGGLDDSGHGSEHGRPRSRSSERPGSPTKQRPPRAWCTCFRGAYRPNSWQFRTYKRMNTIAAVLTVLAIVVVMLVFFFMDVEDIPVQAWYSQDARNSARDDDGDPVVTPVAVASTLCTVSLIVEVVLRWYCHLYTYEGRSFIYFLCEKDNFPFNIIDSLLALMDVLTLAINFQGIPALKSAKAVRMIKLVRVARAAKAISKLTEVVDDEELPFWESPLRYRFTPQQQIQTMLEIVTVLGEVSLVHREDNLIALLAAFKTSYVADAVDAVALYQDVIAAAPQLATFAAPVLAQLGGPEREHVDPGLKFDEIMLDLCLYEHQSLVQSALNLLMVQHSVREALLRDLHATQLLSQPEEERQGLRLRGILAELQSNAERHELWGDIEDDAEKKTNDRVKTVLRELAAVCMRKRSKPGARCAYEPVPMIQSLLYNLGALDVAMAVIGLEASMTEGMDSVVRENTRDIIRLCMVFLQWFVRGHKVNQLAAYEHLDVFVDCFEHDILAPNVIAEVVRGNAELTKNFPVRIVTECANRLITGGRNHDYLVLLESLLFLEEGEVENNVELQFAVLRELSRPPANEPVMWLCQDPRSTDYEERVELMEEGARLLEDAARTRLPPPHMTPNMDDEYMTPLLRYHTKLLEVLAGCALGSVNITTVEAKLQNLYRPKQLLDAILDERCTLDVRYALSTFLYHTVIEVEIAVPDFGGASAWRFVETMPKAFRDAAETFTRPMSHGLCADGAVGVTARLQLAHANLCSLWIRPIDPLAQKPEGDALESAFGAILPKTWLTAIVGDVFDSLNDLFAADPENMPADHRANFHDALVRLSMALRDDSRYGVPPLDAAAPERPTTAQLHGDGAVDTNADVHHIVTSFNSIPKLSDGSTDTELRIEPLIMKLVEHTLVRMQPHARGKKLDAECTRTTRWLVKIFRAMIEERWGMTIDERDEDGGEEQDEAAYDLQIMLNRSGVTKLCLLLIAPGIDRDLSLEAIKLCIALLFREGGCKAVQKTIHDVLSDDSELFFKAVREYMTEIKNYYLYGDPPLVEDEDEDVEIPGTCMVMRFLQLMSEGHFEPNQDIMREQPLTNINLLDEFVELLSILSRDKNRCRSSTKAAAQAAATILEVIQGPCKKNQMHLAIHTELIEILNRITRSKPIRDCLAVEDDLVRITALEIYEGLLEGETGASVIITRIISVIDLDVLKTIIEHRDNSDDDEDSAELTDIQMESLVLVQMFFDFRPELRETVTLSPRVRRLMGKRVTSVEVVWNGTILRRFFPVPVLCDHIAEATKQNLVTFVDRSSDEARLQDFLQRAEDIYREIEHQQLLEEVEIGKFNLSTIFSRRNQEYATWLAFVTAVGPFNNTAYEPGNPRNFKTKQDDYMWTGGGNHGRMLMNLILTPLNVFNIGLSSFTLLLFIVVRCPVTYQKLVDNGYGKARAMFYTSLDPMTIYYFIYTVLAALALRFRVCSSLLLLDIVVKDPTSQDVINAIVYPRRQLGATALLGFFVVYIFALLIFQAYSDGFSYEDDPEGTGGSFPEDCRSLLRCMAVTMMYGLRLSGGIGDIMKHTWSTRLWIDFMYFLVVLIVLLNVIFGIIIDTFSDLRGQKGDRVFKTIHSCFICGVDDMSLDRASPEPGGFRRHIREDHRMWDYLNFIIFIWEQDKDEDDGLELYVRQNIEMKDITWLPVGRDAQIMKSVETSSEHLRKFVEANQKKLEKRVETLDDRIAAAARGDGPSSAGSQRSFRAPPAETPPRGRDAAPPDPKRPIDRNGDPYVFARALSDGVAFGETERIWMSPTPAWPRATSALRLAHPTIGGAVTVELWHCHRRGTGYFLGHVSLEIDPTTIEGKHDLKLQKKAGAKAQTDVQGNISLSCALAFAEQRA
ncbi:hypothetical protein JL720_3580 [Aureococcus anophagefferens]|nr:hypothetical protein JL720_3580 [Aureococcus anophagefferens]